MEVLKRKWNWLRGLRVNGLRGLGTTSDGKGLVRSPSEGEILGRD